MNTDQRKVGSGFWLGWFCASLMGYGAGTLLGMIVGYGLFGDRAVFDGITVGLVAGSMAGILQWIVIREQVARSKLWVPATAVGLAAAFGSAAAAPGGVPVMAGFLIAVFGIGGGALQWLALRRGGVARAGLWIPANLLALMTCPTGLRLAYDLGEAGNYTLAAMVLGLLMGAGIGVVNGALLLWLLRQSPSRDVEGLAAAQ